MTRNASAVWNGDLKSGDGHLETQSGILKDSKYSFNTRFGDEPGTNPEELIAAAHAGCYAMATANALAEAGVPAEKVEATSRVTMENLALTKSELTVTITAPGQDEAKVRERAEWAKANCPISKALNLEITLDLTVNS